VSEEWLTVEEVMGRAKVRSRETVRRWLRSGALRGTLLSDRLGWRIKASELERFLTRGPRGKALAA